MELKIKCLTEKAQLPAYQSKGAACFDIHSLNGGVVPARNSAVFDTGLAFEIPEGYALMVYSRSGHGFKNDIRLANSTGIIDSDYRGEVKVKLTNDGAHPFEVKAGERIAQAMIIKVEQVRMMIVSELNETERGNGGFGSTGS